MEPNFENVKIGELVEVALIGSNAQRSWKEGYHAGAKIHWFNKEGVFLGTLYEFVSYKNIRFRKDSPVWCKMYMGKPFEKIRQFVYKQKCKLITRLIK